MYTPEYIKRAVTGLREPHPSLKNVANTVRQSYADLIETQAKENAQLRTAAKNSAATLVAIYEWVDRVNAVGGATCIEGAAKCHAMLHSLNKNRPRVEKLVLAPLRAALKT